MTSAKEFKEASNTRTICALYEAFSGRDIETIQLLLASDIEWWYHGPPAHQYMMRFLTGTGSNNSSNTGSRTSSASSVSSSDGLEDIEDSSSFLFVPSSITALDSLVIVEGCDFGRLVSWVHVWTVSEDNGIVTQVREYFNTSLTIARFEHNWNSNTNEPSSSRKSRTSPLVNSVVWESKLSSTIGISVPGLLLAI
ncbi:hypothetical protein C5167_027846 [Papaver somniferum]|uniref:senescence associated gene 20-like n=1 Tax=Papaver somniferum TaxID=3469 RepID=UPI000E6F8EC7|nr:senescence associated gene 20-like [Papaver somniferum]RZC91770.1 hypothetical protein C5167_027846 [Papaver somniferum]